MQALELVSLRSHHLHLLHHLLLQFAQIIVLHAQTQPTVNNVVVGTTFTVWIVHMLHVFKHAHLGINQTQTIVLVFLFHHHHLPAVEKDNI
jgi:hypothetical protein